MAPFRYPKRGSCPRPEALPSDMKEGPDSYQKASVTGSQLLPSYGLGGFGGPLSEINENQRKIYENQWESMKIDKIR